jgi:hypothetical protein
MDKEVAIYLKEMTKRDRIRNLEQASRVSHAKTDSDGLDAVRAFAAQRIQEARAGGTA